MLKNYSLSEVKRICEAHTSTTCEGCELYYDCQREFARAPENWQIDASRELAEVVHGHWIDDCEEDSTYANCSNCGLQIDAHENRGYHNYCPNCGAKMDADGERKGSNDRK